MASKAVRGETPVPNCFSLKMTCIISAHSPLAKTSHMTLIKLQAILGNVGRHMGNVGNHSLFLQRTYTLYRA